MGSNRTSTITIDDDDSPHGILFFNASSITVQENVTAVDITVVRTAGTFGDVSVLVRTIGGGESWTSEASEEIGDLLRARQRANIPEIGDDYYELNRRLTFNVS